MKKFSIQRAFAVLLAMAMLVTSMYVPDRAAYAAAKPAKIRSVKLKIGTKNVTKKTYKMTKGKTKKLKVTIKPASSKKAVTYRSKNKKIVSVSKKGQLKAKKVGTAKIMVKVAGKKGAKKKTWVKIKVSKKKKVTGSKDETDSGNKDITDKPSTPDPTVTPDTPDTPDKPSTPNTPGISGGGSTGYGPSYPSNSSNGQETDTIVSTQQDLLAALKKQPSEVTFQTNSHDTVRIQQGEYKDTTLIVNAPNATIENAAVYKEIKIKAIGAHTWVEKSAIANRINVVAPKGAHIKVADKAQANIEVNEGAGGVVEVDNQGTINSFSLFTKATLRIEGNKQNLIPLTIEENGKDATVNTSVPLKMTAKAAIVLQLRGGAEKDSEIQVSNTDAMPTIVAVFVGYLQVTNLETGRADDVLVTMPSKDDYGFGDEPLPEDKGSIKGTVKRITVEGDTHKEEPLKDAVVHVIPYERRILQSDIEAALEAAQEQKKCYEINTNEDGKYTVGKIPYGNYVIVVKAADLQTYLYTIVLNEESKQMDAITMIPSSASGDKGSIKGSIKDAFNGELIQANLKLYLRKGAGTVAGKVEQETTTIDGKYSFQDVPIGIYTIRVVDERQVAQGENYINVAFNVIVLKDMTIGKDMAITKAVADEQIRFVLRWGEGEDSVSNEVPRDLDSHLVGPGATENDLFHTYFSQKAYPENSTDSMEAKLDYDYKKWIGPETTTIYKKKDGVYHFYVYNFSAWDHLNENLAASQAKVDVYLGGRLLTTYHVPDGKGTLWDVCTYDIHSGEEKITPINEIYDYPHAFYKKIGLVDEVKQELNTLIQEYKKNGEKYFGTAAAEDVKKELESVEADMASSKEKYGEKEFCELMQRYVKLEKYFDDLWSSTSISEVAFTNKVKCEILRGYEVTDGCSKINLYGSSDTFSGGFKITFAEGENVTFEPKDLESMTSCPKTVTVTNSRTKVQETYQIQYEKYNLNLDVCGITFKTEGYKNVKWNITRNAATDSDGNSVDVLSITGSALQMVTNNSEVDFDVVSDGDTEIETTYTPKDANEPYVGELQVKATAFDSEKVYYVTYGSLLEPVDVTDEDNENQIYSWYVEHNGINGSVDCIHIYGAKDALTTSGPALKFDSSGDNEVESKYTPLHQADGNGYNGKFTLQYKGVSKHYFVKYKQGYPEIELTYLWEDKHSMTLLGKVDNKQDGNSIYSVTGTQEELSDSTHFYFNVDVDEVTITAESSSSLWNYKLTLKYKGNEEIIYINYTKK